MSVEPFSLDEISMIVSDRVRRVMPVRNDANGRAAMVAAATEGLRIARLSGYMPKLIVAVRRRQTTDRTVDLWAGPEDASDRPSWAYPGREDVSYGEA